MSCTTMLEDMRPPCRFFALGKCRFGSACSFSHDIVRAQTDVICHFFQKGDCKYGNRCRFRHDMPEEGSSRQIDEDPTNNNASEAPDYDHTCGICFENIPRSGKRFALQLGCDHCYCLDCLRLWRTSETSDKEVVQGCPSCRTKSEYVVPSAIFATAEEKQIIIDEYKRQRSETPCKHFNGTIGSCRYGGRCYYAHLDNNGVNVKQEEKRMRHDRVRHHQQSRQHFRHRLRSQRRAVARMRTVSPLRFGNRSPRRSPVDQLSNAFRSLTASNLLRELAGRMASESASEEDENVDNLVAFFERMQSLRYRYEDEHIPYFVDSEDDSDGSDDDLYRIT